MSFQKHSTLAQAEQREREGMQTEVVSPNSLWKTGLQGCDAEEDCRVSVEDAEAVDVHELDLCDFASNWLNFEERLMVVSIATASIEMMIVDRHAAPHHLFVQLSEKSLVEFAQTHEDQTRANGVVVNLWLEQI